MTGFEARSRRQRDGADAVLALDIGGTKLAAAVITPDGATHGLLVEPTHREQRWQTVVDRLFRLGRRAITRAGLARVHAVGIACGGPLDTASGTLFSPIHLPGWRAVPIASLAREAFAAPSALQNDATAAALAEYRFGVGRGVASMLYVTISTGIGGGAVIGGSLHAGAAGNGTEFGHVTVRRGGRRCGCGRRGCIEAYASGSAIAQRAREALAAGRTSVLAALAQVTAADVAAAAAAGDRLALELWGETVDLLGAAITDLVNVFEPNLVVLGGGVTGAGDMLLDPVRSVVAREAMPSAAASARLALAELGDLAGVIGAGIVGLEAAQRAPLPTSGLHV